MIDLMEVLVTGGAGYIGNFVSEKLLEHNHDVRVLDSMLWGQEALAEFEGDDSLEIREGDIRHIENLTYATEG
jgi:nucleoside-diphosphate-sugar epimerase